jgi:3-oxoadipate enol-lactonase
MNFFVANGVGLAYRIDGPDDAPALVLLNSLGTDLHMWDPQVALLRHTLRIIRYDYPGHGSSDVPTESYTLERFGIDLLTLFDWLGLERAHICGLSLGGMVALWFAASYQIE